MEYFKKFMSIFKKPETSQMNTASNIDRSYKERQDEKKAELDRIATGITKSSAQLKVTEEMRQEMKRLSEQEGIARNLQVEKVRIEIDKLPEATPSPSNDLQPSEANLWMLTNEIEATERLLEKTPKDPTLTEKLKNLHAQSVSMTKQLSSKDQPAK